MADDYFRIIPEKISMKICIIGEWFYRFFYNYKNRKAINKRFLYSASLSRKEIQKNVSDIYNYFSQKLKRKIKKDFLTVGINTQLYVEDNQRLMFDRYFSDVDAEFHSFKTVYPLNKLTNRYPYTVCFAYFGEDDEDDGDAFLHLESADQIVPELDTNGKIIGKSNNI